MQIGPDNIDPELSPSTLDGYSTYHQPLPQPSPVIDRGNPSGCTDFHGVALFSDQLGEPRVYGSGVPGYAARCDPGAAESASLRDDILLPMIQR
jgi:hypothetical protein